MGPANETVGILIPTYNRCSYLSIALQSVLGQTWQDIEVIVIDNGSTDGTALLMKGISDARVRYIVNASNIGMIGSINTGLRLFSPHVKWCTVLPDDDILHRDYVKNMLEARDGFSQADVINCCRFIIDQTGCVVPAIISTPPVRESALEYLENRAVMRRKTYLAGIFFSLEACGNIGGYPQFTTGLTTDDAFIFALSMRQGLYYAYRATAFIRMHSSAESNAAAGSTSNLDALKDFSAYVKAVSASSRLFDPRALDRIDAVLKRYLERMNSDMVLRELNAVALSPDTRTAKEAVRRSLFARTEEQGFSLLLPVRIYLIFLQRLPSLIFLYRLARGCIASMRTLRYRLRFHAPAAGCGVSDINRQC
ncbi:MAG: glycosyltransferase family 2 protein [Nitrospirota bacterium]